MQYLMGCNVLSLVILSDFSVCVCVFSCSRDAIEFYFLILSVNS